ncbi:Purine nucleoside phosphorylase 1 [Novipirellula galeiformis]|uniref:Purine nucleoside phosphorylase n=1 Tax=Novipirellula galeiformis TaxID=2528004 RepID=A0A5C6C093_9BACT|nr:purine-nucleoside phosphorylase [Novipirellula galeiformis]TWU17522.1 Purine nucleoside phosphorylase 1 [Novipirellula galeiformis]
MQQNRSTNAPPQTAPSLRRIDEAVALIRQHTELAPAVAIILGSGLGGFAEKIEDAVAIPFAAIPGFATSTASGHRGQLLIGQCEQVPVVAMAGRFHCYEGWNRDQVAFPVQVMAAIGAKQLVVSNAAGGLNPKLKVGDIVVIRDHLDFLRGNGLSNDSGVRDANLGNLGEPRGGFPPLHHGNAYDPAMSKIALTAAMENNFAAYQGTYLATLGPNYETRAEYRMMRRMGADVAGMSTVPEVLAAMSVGMRTLGLSMVSNVANPDSAAVANHEEVLAAGRAAEGKMEAIVRAVLRQEFLA